MDASEARIKALDSAHWELGEAFQGLEDADVWRRPHPRLLSIGELAAHVAYGEAAAFLGEDRVRGALAAPAARYYTANIEEPFTLALGAEEVLAEVRRVHQRCKDAFESVSPDMAQPNPHREGWSWGYTLEYQAFHVAYHTGQVVSVRHLLGHATPDN